jgi:hypothetical protein
MKWPWSPKHYDHDAEREKFLNSIPAVQETPAAAEEKHMASFTSILSDVGSGLKKFFSVVIGAAEVAEPFIDVLFPGFAVLYNTTVAAAANAEANAIAAGAQNGTGAQKLAFVVSAIEKDFNSYTSANGLVAPSQAVIEAYVNAVVASINAIPATKAS